MGEAHASFILDWALVSSGRFDLATHSERALEIYQQLGDLNGEAVVLQNLGAFAYFQGRWDEAVELYERGREARLRVGNDVDAAMGTANIAEVLADQGHYEMAEQYLQETLRVLPRRELPLGRRLRAEPARAGREPHRPLRRGARPLRRRAQRVRRSRSRCRRPRHRRSAGRLPRARGPGRGGARARGHNAAGVDAGGRRPARRGVAAPRARLRAVPDGRRAAAREAFDASLASARARDADYEVALTLVALATLAGVADPEQVDGLERESAALLARLGVRSLPAVPIPPEVVTVAQ